MRRRLLILLIAMMLCLTAAVPALAANIFMFTEKTVTLTEGGTYQTVLRREGNLDGDGEIVYASGKQSVATVTQDGMITAVGKGKTEVTALLNRNGKRVGKAVITVNVTRGVTGVKLNSAKLSVYAPDDPAVTSLLAEPTTDRVLLIPAGTTAALSANCMPADATNKKVTFTTTDAAVASVTGSSLKALKRGECDLIAASEQNPQAAETIRVLVIQPVKAVRIDAGAKKVAAGSTLQLTAACSPENATVAKVTWSSKNPSIARVDENGLVTGVKKGSTNITATAADGSRTSASVQISVTQPAESISFKNPEIVVNVGKSVSAKATVLPANASDKTLSWSVSDTSIATVNNYGQISGKKAGVCTVTCTSNANPELSATATVTVAQLVTKIECTVPEEKLSMLAGGTLRLAWNVEPDDATDKGLVYKSQHPKVVTVDSDGVVTATGRGTGVITATARDGSGRKASVKIHVIQPVTGVRMQQTLYYVQRGWNTNIRAVVEPRNANNQSVYWTSDDEMIATVRPCATSTGSVRGITDGYTTVTAHTEDGDFAASATVRVGNFNRVVMPEELLVDSNNNIRIVLRNMSQDITLGNVHYMIECFDLDGEPFVCSTDGVSTFFEGDYPYLLSPYDTTIHGSFRFQNYVIDRPLGKVVLTVISWRDEDGNQWQIPESERVRFTWTRTYNNPNQGVG